jgi:hypothetical protein
MWADRARRIGPWKEIALKLICYVRDGWDPQITPMHRERDWMDNSPDRFAYRCLPLAMANMHGWQIGSPCGFEVRWNGGPSNSDVEVSCDGGTPENRKAVSWFGQATVTIHIEGLIRTPPGWNLWVSGPPNAAKDGISPLSGLIETDWSPYSFTMNWQLTRANHWVRFEVGEPICFFFPVAREPLESWDTEFHPLENDPETQAAFEEWSASRTSFQKYLSSTPPEQLKNKWQKLYFQGTMPDGKPGCPEHQTKLRLSEFAKCPANHRTTDR